MRRRAFTLLAVLALIAAACTHPSATTSPTPAPASTPPPEPAMALPMFASGFGRLPSIPLIVDTPAYAGPVTPHSIDQVDMVDPERRVVSDPAVREVLERNGFVIVPTDTTAPYGGRLFWPAYEFLSPQTIYVTTDVGYHYWHLLFDKILRSLEQDVFLPKLRTLASGMLAGAQEQAQELKQTSAAADAERVLGLMQVEAALVGVPAGTMSPAATKELALVREHARMTRSPLLGTEVDYSLFTPRGHYTRNEELTSFFYGMSLLGQSPFAVDPSRPTLLRPGVLAARVLLPQGTGTPELFRLWKDIERPTAFLVGSADDYSPAELAEAVAARVPGGLKHPDALTPAVMADVVKNLLDSRDVLIDPETPSMRLMGVRFVLDSWILDQLLYPSVGTETDPRIVASPLDLASAFGSPFARRTQEQAGQNDYAHYNSQMKSMRQAVEAVPDAAWGGTVYNAWLWSLEPTWIARGTAFPDTMQTKAWTAKSHQTGFGSYAELRHDTILYVKQAAAEGAGEMPPFTPRNWVEPDPVAFLRLAAVVDLMRDGLAKRDLLTEQTDGLLADLAELEAFFGRVAQDELAGAPISDADNQRIANISHELEGLWWRTSDQGGPYGGTLDDDAAIIADIQRAVDEAVEIGTGRIDTIYVIVPDDHGGFQLAQGGVYSYYEFLQPISDRLTDEAWRAMLDAGDQPDRPAWEEAFLP
jgi:hypothetical protein